MSGLQFDVTVKKLLDSPARTSVHAGKYRVNGRGPMPQENTFQLLNGGAAKTFPFIGSEFVVTTDRLVSLTLTKAGGLSIVIPIYTLCVMTLDYTQLQFSYTDGSASNTDLATLTLFQA